MTARSSNRAFARRPPSFLENVRVILVEPQTPGNIGSACRAMKTMGLTNLVLVNPVPFRQHAEARNFAHGAHDVLESARVVQTLGEAIGDLHLLVGTTNRRRIGVLPEMCTAREAAQRVAETAPTHRVGLLFGREDRGLTTPELTHCQVIATIPAAEGMPSLNLSHAVQVFAYEVFQASLGTTVRRPADLANLAEQEALLQRVNALLLAIGFVPFRNDSEAFAQTLRRVFGRAGMQRQDVRALHKLVSALQRRLGLPQGASEQACRDAPEESVPR
ncbi:MAG: RNA methyltransferase [Armatimonadota bacterium]|nr:RNA methyltransferase [Armatimonadota bacterium]